MKKTLLILTCILASFLLLTSCDMLNEDTSYGATYGPSGTYTRTFKPLRLNYAIESCTFLQNGTFEYECRLSEKASGGAFFYTLSGTCKYEQIDDTHYRLIVNSNDLEFIGYNRSQKLDKNSQAYKDVCTIFLTKFSSPITFTDSSFTEFKVEEDYVMSQNTNFKKK